MITRKNPTDSLSVSTEQPTKKNSIGDAVNNFIADHLLAIPNKPLEERVARLSAEQELQIKIIEEKAIANFKGQLDELESALGMLRMGHHFGWKVLYLIHSKRTIRKYETILGDIKIRDLFPETGPSSYRSYGLAYADKYPNFWKVVSGEFKILDRKKIE